jgi:hypothetical protein
MTPNMSGASGAKRIDMSRYAVGARRGIMITLNVKTPIGRDIHTNGHRGKSFYTAPCKINVFAGAVLLETVDANGKADYRAELIAKEGNSPVDVDLQKVTAAPTPPMPKPAPKPAPKPSTKKASKSPAKPGRARSGGAR